MYSIGKDLAKRTISDKILKDRAYESAIKPKYDGYQRGLASMVYKFFDKKIGSGMNVNEVLAQELHKPMNKKFDQAPRKVIWWAMRKLVIEEWVVQFVQSMYNNTRRKVRVNNTYSDEFGIKAGVHQGSVLSPLLFIIVVEALSHEFYIRTP